MSREDSFKRDSCEREIVEVEGLQKGGALRNIGRKKRRVAIERVAKEESCKNGIFEKTESCKMRELRTEEPRKEERKKEKSCKMGRIE